MKALNTTHDAAVSEPELAGVIQQFQRWRASRGRMEKIPDALWHAASSLYPRYTVFRIARALRLPGGCPA
mgnify:FL=1